MNLIPGHGNFFLHPLATGSSDPALSGKHNPQKKGIKIPFPKARSWIKLLESAGIAPSIPQMAPGMILKSSSKSRELKINCNWNFGV